MGEFVFGTRSMRNLNGVHPSLVSVVRRALELTTTDFAVIEGVRTVERQQDLYDQGRVTSGKIVTWTMHSKHLVQADGFGHAVDVLPVNPAIGKPDWGFVAGFDAVAKAMFAAADELGAAIRWGRDWDRDHVVGEPGEVDAVHFELIGANT